ncbi:terminase [Candidatus Pacearchaeota archaeon]|nr:terminase [Candidatus Pacearchaeota archaeon]
MRWLDADEELRDRYARAKEAQADFMADEMLDIADDGRNDWMKRHQANGESVEVVNNEVIQRSKLRIDARKWLASKLKPKKYSEKLQQEISGPGGGPVQTNATINFIPVSKKPKDK